ncbi:TetR-like C-terminal domain-containing protein [Paenibacillus sp. FSL R10-2199]|uniref:TetR/AcrR family transcriptional regulator n=1 Tax=Paenibacillus sp. FSL R10-2199 TaxID=2975348 RepID=UPI001E5ADA7D|nr:TetR-like C-terminal domain-containing protein [Paenibacillus sp. FSL P4-0081]
MEPVNLRTDPRVIRTRHLIKEAFVELLEEREINKITVNVLAERATINRVTFYLHYQSIPDMIEKFADEMIEDIRDVLKHPQEDENGDWPFVLGLFTHIGANSKFYKVILASKRTPLFMEKLKEFLTETISARFESSPFTDKSTIQKGFAIWYISAALIGIIIAWLRADMPYSPAYLAKQFNLMHSYDKTNLAAHR